MRAIQILLLLILVVLTAKFYPSIFESFWKIAAFLFAGWIAVVVIFWGLVIFVGVIAAALKLARETFEMISFFVRSWLSLAASPLTIAALIYRRAPGDKTFW